MCEIVNQGEHKRPDFCFGEDKLALLTSLLLRKPAVTSVELHHLDCKRSEPLFLVPIFFPQAILYTHYMANNSFQKAKGHFYSRDAQRIDSVTGLGDCALLVCVPLYNW